ncbi:hypothetical protein FH972_025786 [Carpinus fangiana]|uniref:F-actin-capping protein subunit beta n=1 Tax=Carpinus fangiana TaxID=176857 RepID=A0A5N6L311_9ROSI|nr:hypothetical protein FH972_025786 [Carpinus fangiana]
MADPDPFDSALDLLRRLNPAHTSKNLDALCQLAPSLTEDLLSSVDQPLEVRKCKKTGREYLLCDYNRDGDSWRSPWSNEFEPPIEDDDGGTVPSDRVRKMEIKLNDGIDIYRDLYYDGGVSSVYLWDLDDGFAGVVLLKKSNDPPPPPPRPGSIAHRIALLTSSATASAPQTASTGSWDSIHVFESVDRARMSHYKLTSTVILQLGAKSEALGNMSLGGNLTRQVEQDMPAESDDSHVSNIGKMIEDMELKMRNLLQEVYFGKAKDVVGDLRSISSLSEANRDKATHREMISGMSK